MEHYDILKTYNSCAYLVRRKLDNQELLLKKYPNCRREEITLLLSLDHLNLVRITEIFIEEKKSKEFLYLKKDPLLEAVEEKQLKSSIFSSKEIVQVPSNFDDVKNYCYVVSEFPPKGTFKEAIQRRRKQVKKQEGSTLASFQIEESTGISGTEHDGTSPNCILKCEVDGNSESMHFSESSALYYFCRVFNVLYYLHQKKIFHQYVTTRNIFLDDFFVLKLGLPDLISYEALEDCRFGDQYECLAVERPFENLSDLLGVSKGSMTGNKRLTAVPLLNTESIRGLHELSESSESMGTYSQLLENNKKCFNLPADNWDFTCSQKKSERERMWALGCLLYEILCLAEPFDDPSLENYLNNVFRRTYKPLPQVFSLEVKDLVARLLNPLEDNQCSEEELLSLPLLQPVFSRIFEEDKKIRCFLENRKCLEQEETQNRHIFISEENKEWKSIIEIHDEFLQLMVRRESFFMEMQSIPFRILESNEEKERIFIEGFLEAMEMIEIDKVRITERTFIQSAEMHIQQISLMEVVVWEIMARDFIDTLEEPFYLSKLRSLISTNRLLAELKDSSDELWTTDAAYVHRVPPLPHLPPLCADFCRAGSVPLEAARCFYRTTFFTDEEKSSRNGKRNRFLSPELVENCVADQANFLFQGDGLKRPILHEIMRRGDIGALRIALSTNQPLDFTAQDCDGCTPLHWIFCGDKTAGLLNTILDRVQITHRHLDRIDWSMKDNRGNDFMSSSAYYGSLGMIWDILKSRRVHFFQKYKGRFEVGKAVRLGDMEQIARKDRERFYFPSDIQR